MRRRGPGRAAAPVELEALDPVTGESLTVSGTATGAGARAGTVARERAHIAARRRRRLATVFGLLAIACAVGATYFGVSIAQLRGVERTWRSAMAVDAARADADRQVRAVVAETLAEDPNALLLPLEAIGTEAAAGLRRHERTLADRRLLDSKLSALRDEMVEALEFRRFQMSPQRNQIGDTPLQHVELEISVQLDRWKLSRSRVARPELTSLAAQLARFRTYADADTGATLFALDGMTLHTIDVDGSVRRQREVPLRGDLVPVAGGVAVADGRRVLLYPADASEPPFATIDDDGGGNLAFAAGDDSGDLWVVQQGGTTVRRFRVDGTASSWATLPEALPEARIVVGATTHDLVLESVVGGLELWSPSARTTRVLASEGARFLAARGTTVLWQGPLPFSPRDGSDFLHRFDTGTDARELIGLPRTDGASAGINADGIVAIAAGPLAGRLASILLLGTTQTALIGGTGPRASVEPGAIAWSEDGRSLFWLTPDGAIGMAHGDGGPGTRQLVRTGLIGLDRLTVLDR